MGEKWRHDRAKGFQQQQCRAYREQLASATLFSHQPDVLERSYCCEGRTPMHRLIGEYVLVKVVDKRVTIIHENLEVAEMTEPCATAVALAIGGEQHCAGMAVAVVDDASELTTELHISLVDHSAEGK